MAATNKIAATDAAFRKFDDSGVRNVLIAVRTIPTSDHKRINIHTSRSSKSGVARPNDLLIPNTARVATRYAPKPLTTLLN